ncbi:acyl-CoA thioester hydrolase [Salinibacillus kushneri]|uniref:Acyl-CoA thioester hydrolase n=1 Tax=Salinibacillus kushneri TaxID=237682 RepID=A0A1I0E225_9BACI|nr:thioesterase family protein [Salinibacillus kushneri]SET38224.1 acyl-CoA thioester hydrolase [Salinibacillus kushneri]
MKVVETDIKVRYQETDQMGVVYHANYLVWFEIGRTAFFEELGFQYHEMEKEEIVAPVLDADIQFKTPVRYGEKAIVRTWIHEYDGLKVVYAYEILNGSGEISVTGKTTHVCVKKDTFKPVSTRKKFPDLHQAYLEAKGDE